MSLARLVGNRLMIRSIRMASTSSSSRRLDGKVAIVTASTDGIGFSIAQRLGEDGARVVISSRKQNNVDAAVQKLSALNLDVTGLVCHVAKQEDRQKLLDHAIAKYGGVDILVSNAAANPHFGNMLSCNEDQWDKIFDTNIKSAFFLCKEVIPHIEKRGGGSIVFVSSIAGYQPFEFLGPYSVSKTALIGLTKALSHEAASMDIRVNCLAPGIIKTKFSEQLWKNPDAESMATGMIPMKRFGEPSECGGAVSFLVSDDASYITGETILVAGGTNARL